MRRPHLLGVDDAPFRKRQERPVRLVGVLMEGNDLVEGIAVTGFPVDGDDATGFLADWIGSLRWHAAIQGVILGGITVAGLGIVDLEALASRLDRPVLAATRHDPAESRIEEALLAAGLAERLPLTRRSPTAVRMRPGLHVAFAGVGAEKARALVEATLRKSRMPEPLRLAHLIGSALERGQSRGRV